MSPVIIGIKKSERSETIGKLSNLQKSYESQESYESTKNEIHLKDGYQSLFHSNTNSFISDIYNPMNLASIICNKFKYNKKALVMTFMQDIPMFKYLYEFLPKDILVEVINNISLHDAIKIVKIRQCSTYIYDEVNPILYIIRYFNDLECSTLINKDPHCYEFNKNIIPKDSVLNFVLGCKEYISQSNFEQLVNIATKYK
jgi:hypothetical protein